MNKASRNSERKVGTNLYFTEIKILIYFPSACKWLEYAVNNLTNKNTEFNC